MVAGTLAGELSSLGEKSRDIESRWTCSQDFV